MSDEPWVCVRAVAWVFDHAPDVPANLVATLLGVARHARDDGTAAYPSIDTLIGYTRKSRRQVRYDLQDLCKRGLLTISPDQSPAAHIRADRRPTVYDLPLHAREAAGGSPLHAVRGATDCTPSKPRGAIQRTTGCNTASNGVQPIAPEEDLKNPEESLLSPREAPTAVPTEDRERDRDSEHQPQDVPALAVQRRYLAQHGITDPDEADRIIGAIESEHNVRSNAFWHTVARNGDLPALIAAACVPTVNTTAVSSRSTFLASLADLPGCPDGYPGGNVAEPGTGWMLCARCRRASGWKPSGDLQAARPRGQPAAA